MMACICKLQGAIVSSHSTSTGQKAGAPKERASAVVTRRDPFKAKDVPELTTTYVPLPTRPLIKIKEMEESAADDHVGSGNFGRFGGKFVPETLIACLNQLEAEFNKALRDEVFQVIRNYIHQEFQILIIQYIYLST